MNHLWRQSRRLLIAICCFAFTSVQGQDALPGDEAAFTRYVGQRIAKSTGVKTESEGRLSLRLLTSAGEYLLTANLDRIWSACQRAQERCHGFIAEYVSGVSSVIAERARPVEKASLRLAVRPTSYLENLARDSKVAPPMVRPLVGDLSIALVVDTPRAIRMTQRKDLEKLGISEADAFEVGKANLKTELKPLRSVLKPIRGQTIGYLEENAYESSRLVFHDEWGEYVREIGGSLIVAVPTTNTLLYGSGSTAEAVDVLRALALNVARKSQRPLSPLVFRWTDSGWQVVP